MERVSANVYKRISGYWQRKKGYDRLNGDGRKRKTRIAELGSSRRRRFWRIKLTRRLKLKLRFSPKRFLLGLRDAYVNMMMKIANSRMVVGDGVTGFRLGQMKEYDERMIVDIYKSIVMAQGQLVHRDAAWNCSEITCPR